MCYRTISAVLLLWLGTAGLASAGEAQLVAVSVVRPDLQVSTPEVIVTGEIRARVQSNISFRTDGKIMSRNVDVGAHVTPADILATLDSSQLETEVARSQAGLSSAQALLDQARLDFSRQETLLASGFTTRTNFDQARKNLDTSQAQERAAEAALQTAKEQLSYASLKVDRPGVIVARNAEAGQVVQSGQTIFVLAQDGPRDAVFNVADTLVNGPIVGTAVEILLQSDSGVRATGVIREVSPIIDNRTGTVAVTVGIDQCPPEMTLGVTVLARGRGEGRKAFVVPWGALTEWNGRPSVWVVNDKDEVSPQTVEVLRYAAGTVVVAKGLNEGQRVVAAGVQFLYPGQKVAVLDGAARERP